MFQIAVFLCGVLFALGLGVAGMTQPTKIIAFLDVAGDWDPSLLFVMGGAIAVNWIFYRISLRRLQPVFQDKFIIPSHRKINSRLIIGSTLFGIGWGLSGYCPGPAWVVSVNGAVSTLAFLTAMLAGMFLFQIIQTEELPPGVAKENANTESSCG
jgi:uncharacterized membrane protein YedE/YeeE